MCILIGLGTLGNGFIEGRELDDLLRELASSVGQHDGGPEASTDDSRSKVVS